MVEQSHHRRNLKERRGLDRDRRDDRGNHGKRRTGEERRHEVDKSNGSYERRTQADVHRPTREEGRLSGDLRREYGHSLHRRSLSPPPRLQMASSGSNSVDDDVSARRSNSRYCTSSRSVVGSSRRSFRDERMRSPAPRRSQTQGTSTRRRSPSPLAPRERSVRGRRSLSPSLRREKSMTQQRRRSLSPGDRTASSYCGTESDDEDIETESQRRDRWEVKWEQTKHEHPPRPQFLPLHQLRKRRRVLEIEYWERTPENADRKQAHMDQLDRVSGMSREQWILNTTLLNTHVAIEPNLFPYETPGGVTHYTLWSRTYMYDDEVESYVEQWLDEYRPNVQAWAWDPSNLSEGMSVDLYHVHVFFWEPPKTRAVIKAPNRSRSHRAQLPSPAVAETRRYDVKSPRQPR